VSTLDAFSDRAFTQWFLCIRRIRNCADGRYPFPGLVLAACSGAGAPPGCESALTRSATLALSLNGNALTSSPPNCPSRVVR
jgi:hypothetical protein